MDEVDFVLAYLNTLDHSQTPSDRLGSVDGSEAFFTSHGLARADVDWAYATPKLKDGRDRLRRVFENLTEDEPDYASLAAELQ